jgi:hypothetical protein
MVNRVKVNKYNVLAAEKLVLSFIPLYLLHQFTGGSTVN